MGKGDSGHTSALYVWNGLCVFWGTSFHTHPHRHNTLQLVFDLDKEFLLKDEQNDWKAYSAAIIKASHLHQLDSNNSIQLFLYLEQEGSYAKLLREKYFSENNMLGMAPLHIGKLGTGFFKKLLVRNQCDHMFQGCTLLLRDILELAEPLPMDARVEKAMHFIKQHPFKRLRVKEVAHVVNLSESRIRYLFKKQVGQSIQSFMLWMRVIASLNDVLKGKQLTKTAYDYGFSDASHMTKSFVDVIGVPPSKIKAYEKEVKIVSCQETNFFSLRTDIISDWNQKEIIQHIKI
ncbi:MAG: AraC family transcriptional regulator [Bacteroidota bacterium]